MRRALACHPPFGNVSLDMTESLCESCAHLREVLSGRGSRFLLCLLAHSDRRFPKYPPQPVLRCVGYKPRPNGGDQKPPT